MGSSFTTIVYQIRHKASLVLAFGMVILISNLLPVLAQGYAWLEMSRKAGGITMLAKVITSAEPCEFCHAALELNSKPETENNPSAPANSRIEFLKSVFTSNGDSFFEWGPCEIAESAKWARPGDFTALPSREDDLETPPPRVSAV